MRFNYVQDYVFHDRLRRRLSKLEKTRALNRFFGCLKLANHDGVAILRQGKRVLYHGLHYCNNAWACPVCAPYKMGKIKRRIDAAFTIMKEKGYKCIMATFTVPSRRADYQDLESHTATRKIIPLGTILYILKRAYSKWWTYTRSVRKLFGDYKSFMVTELTYGERNGWHPHFHCLYWVKEDAFQTLQEKENQIAEKWHTCIKKVIENEVTWDNDAKKALLAFVNKSIAEKNFRGFYISKNADGTLKDVNKSNYFWSAENEVSDLCNKKGHNGNLTQWQMIEKICRDEPDSEKYVPLIAEIINTTFGMNMFKFTANFASELDNYIKEHSTPFEQKKSNTDAETTKPIETVCWLSREQWNLLKYREHIVGLNYILASLAIQDDAFELIKEFCEVFKVGAPLKKPPFTIKFIEKIAA